MWYKFVHSTVTLLHQVQQLISPFTAEYLCCVPTFSGHVLSKQNKKIGAKTVALHRETLNVGQGVIVCVQTAVCLIVWLCTLSSTKLHIVASRKIIAVKPVPYASYCLLVTSVQNRIYGTQSITQSSLYSMLPIVIPADLKVSERSDQPFGPYLRSQHLVEPSFVCVTLPAQARCRSVFMVLLDLAFLIPLDVRNSNWCQLCLFILSVSLPWSRCLKSLIW